MLPLPIIIIVVIILFVVVTFLNQTVRDAAGSAEAGIAAVDLA